MNLVCKKCNKKKQPKSFPKDKNRKNGLYVYCKTCLSKERKDNGIYKQMAINFKKRLLNDLQLKIVLKQKYREKYLSNIPQNLWSRAKQRAKKFNIEFTISVSDIVIPLECPILKVPLIVGTKGNYPNSPSLDRIDNTKGYTKENVQVISTRANSMKSDATLKDLLNFANWIKALIK